MDSKNRAAALCCLSLALLLAGDIGAYWAQTDGGRVDVVGLKFPTENGQWIAADLFRPRTATAKAPAPLVVVCPGFEKSKETMGSYSLELARRGIVAIAIDPYSQGASSSSQSRQSATVEGSGVVPVVEYLYDTPNLNYIDRSRIGAAGYSSGGNAVLQTAARFGARQARALRQVRAKAAAGGRVPSEAEWMAVRSQNKVSAVFVGGYVLSLTEEVLRAVDANVGMDYAYFDEGSFRTEKGNGHLHEAPEALRLLNSVPGRDKVSDVAVGHVYGDPDKRSVRLVYNTRSFHPLMPYAPAHVAAMIDFFTTVFKLRPPAASSRQIWPIKELFTGLALAAALLFLVPFTSLLLRLPVFGSLAHPIPPPPEPPAGARKVFFWAVFAVSALVACFLFIPLVRATAVLFPQASARLPTWWFPQRINNAILLWAVANGAIGLAIFFLTRRFSRAKRGGPRENSGLGTNAGELAKTLGLALTVLAVFYGLVFVSYGIFHTDLRFTFVSAAASFPPRMLIVVLEYLPLFFIFYLANSIRVNCGGHFAGQREWSGMLINAVGNSAGLMLVLAIQYSCLAATGTIYWTDEWLYVNLLLGVIPMMFLLPIFNRQFFRLTGKVYLGPMITCLVFILMSSTNNVCYIPLN